MPRILRRRIPCLLCGRTRLMEAADLRPTNGAGLMRHYRCECGAKVWLTTKPDAKLETRPGLLDASDNRDAETGVPIDLDVR